MGLLSRARVLGYRAVNLPDGRFYIYLPSHRRRRRRRVLRMGQYTQRCAAASPEYGDPRWAATDAELSKKFPAVSEFLLERLTEDGKPRVTSTLMVVAEDGMFKLALTDRAQAGGKFDYKLWRSGTTFYEAMNAIESCLEDGSADWRKFPKWEAAKRR